MYRKINVYNILKNTSWLVGKQENSITRFTCTRMEEFPLEEFALTGR